MQPYRLRARDYRRSPLSSLALSAAAGPVPDESSVKMAGAEVPKYKFTVCLPVVF